MLNIYYVVENNNKWVDVDVPQKFISLQRANRENRLIKIIIN